jgi:hypothetical protein
MQERRTNSEDRRKNANIPLRPFRDCEGYLIVLERRFFPDRRISHLDPNTQYDA